MKRDFVFMSQSVTAAHPDKMADQISDAVVDAYLQRDPFSQINTECAIAKGVLFIAARFASEAYVDIPEVARRVIDDIGYPRAGLSSDESTVLTNITETDLDPRLRLDERELTGEALDRLPTRHATTVFGFACRHSPALMPLPIWLAHRLARRLAAACEDRDMGYLYPDGSAQVAVEYRAGEPRRIHGITLVTSQAEAGAPAPEGVRDDLMARVIEPVFADEDIGTDDGTRFIINPEGPFIRGGPRVHSGLTGRKTAVDSYGEYARHSGNALSGKGPLRIDRVATYAARYVAKNLVAAGLADECEVLLSYMVGEARPVSVLVETFGTGRRDDGELGRLVENHFDLRLGGILKAFGLRHLPGRQPGGLYRRLAAYGQVGRTDLELPWERTDVAEALD